VTTEQATSARRLLGVALVLIVALGLPSVVRWNNRPIAGAAVVARTVVVPGVGDCVGALTGPTPPLLPLVFGISAAVVDEAAVVFSTCVG